MAISWVAHAGFDEGLSAANSGDFRKAFEEWLPLAEQGDALAQLILGVMYGNGQGVPQDYKEAVVWFRQAAEQDDAKAQFGLGFMYANGQGVPQDYKEAVVWYRKAAEQGNASAQNNLGAMYESGQGVPPLRVVAYALYNLSAANGSASTNNAADNRQRVAELMSAREIEAGQALTRTMAKLGNLLQGLDQCLKRSAAKKGAKQ